jgi:hypothetical protein
MNPANDTLPASHEGVEPSEELNVLTVMKALREGEFIQELADCLAEAHSAVSEHGKPASITIKLKINPAGRTFEIKDEISADVPKAPKETTLFFRDGDALVRRDPSQRELSHPSFEGPGKLPRR